MLRRIHIHTLVLLLAVGMTAYAESSQWGYRPVYNAAEPSLSDGELNYTFHSTSVYVPSTPSGYMSYTPTFDQGEESLPYRAPRRVSPWDPPSEDDGTGMGVLAPVGEPMILLVMAVLYGLYRVYRRRKYAL